MSTVRLALLLLVLPVPLLAGQPDLVKAKNDSVGAAPDTPPVLRTPPEAGVPVNPPFPLLPPLLPLADTPPEPGVLPPFAEIPPVPREAPPSPFPVVPPLPPPVEVADEHAVGRTARRPAANRNGRVLIGLVSIAILIINSGIVCKPGPFEVLFDHDL